MYSRKNRNHQKSSNTDHTANTSSFAPPKFFVQPQVEDGTQQEAISPEELAKIKADGSNYPDVAMFTTNRPAPTPPPRIQLKLKNPPLSNIPQQETENETKPEDGNILLQREKDNSEDQKQSELVENYLTDITQKQEFDESNTNLVKSAAQTNNAFIQKQAQLTTNTRKELPTWGKQRQNPINYNLTHADKKIWAARTNTEKTIQPQIQTVSISQNIAQGSIQRRANPQDQKAYDEFVKHNYQWTNYTIGTNGKFDLNYQPATKKVDVTVKVKFLFPDSPGNTKQDKATQQQYRNNYIQQVQKAWSKRYTFQNIRQPQAVWKKLNPVKVNVRVQEVKANEHFQIQAFLKTAGRSQVSGSNLGAFNTTQLFKGSERLQPQFNPQTGQGELTRIQRINPSPILFYNQSTAIAQNYKPKLNFLATYLKRINNPKFNIDIVGHTSKTGKEDVNKLLSTQRATAVATELQKAGLRNHNLRTKGIGSQGASQDKKWNKVEIIASLPKGWQNLQATGPHEFGHMIGLGDEYAGGTPLATHHPLVAKAFGKKYADQVAKRGDTDYASIMEGGNDVRIQHYVTFWSALCDTTLNKAKVPNPRFGYKDWKFIG